MPNCVQYKIRESWSNTPLYSKVLSNIMYIINSGLQLKDGITEQCDSINNTPEY